MSAMASDIEPDSGLVEVRLEGGPLHGRRAWLLQPPARMTLELRAGEPVVYRRHAEGTDIAAGVATRFAHYRAEGLQEDA